MNTTSNDARLTGGADIQDCGEISGTGTLQLDVILPPPGVDAADGIKAWEFVLTYSPAVVKVIAPENQNFLLTQASGSSLLSLSDGLPDSDGAWKSAGMDMFGLPGPEPTGSHEVGPGVITRITLQGVATGSSSLTLTTIIPVAADNSEIPVGDVFNATVVVNGSCPPPFAVDSDGDAFTNTEEAFVGTDPLDACPDDVNDDAWPSDLASLEGYGKHDGVINILDIVQLTPPYFSVREHKKNYSERKDFNGDGIINILDIVRLTPPMFGQSCTP
jgi:hypothetical protein